MGVISAIVCIGIIIYADQLKQSECVKLGFEVALKDPNANYIVDNGYISCANINYNCTNGKCNTRPTYYVVKVKS